MDSTKYIGMDVHKEATTIAVMNAAGKLVMEAIVETACPAYAGILRRFRLSVDFPRGVSLALQNCIQDCQPGREFITAAIRGSTVTCARPLPKPFPARGCR